MSKGKHREHNHLLVPHQGDPTDLAARLTPPEETQGGGSNNGGAIVVDASALRLPKDFTEREEKKGRLLGLEPIAAFILVFSLAFIAFITYLISIEQTNAESEGVKTVITDK